MKRLYFTFYSEITDIYEGILLIQYESTFSSLFVIFFRSRDLHTTTQLLFPRHYPEEVYNLIGGKTIGSDTGILRTLIRISLDGEDVFLNSSLNVGYRVLENKIYKWSSRLSDLRVFQFLGLSSVEEKTDHFNLRVRWTDGLQSYTDHPYLSIIRSSLGKRQDFSRITLWDFGVVLREEPRRVRDKDG